MRGHGSVVLTARTRQAVRKLSSAAMEGERARQNGIQSYGLLLASPHFSVNLGLLCTCRPRRRAVTGIDIAFLDLSGRFHVSGARLLVIKKETDHEQQLARIRR